MTLCDKCYNPECPIKRGTDEFFYDNTIFVRSCTGFISETVKEAREGKKA